MLPVMRNDDLDKIEDYIEKKYNLPTILIAENIGHELFEQIKKDKYLKNKKKILILIRPDNKGAYALVLARKLLLLGKKVKVFNINIGCEPTEAFLKNKKLFLSISNEYREGTKIDELEILINKSELLIEALWKIEDINLKKRLIKIIDKHNFKISIDFPLGLSNKENENAVSANVTYSLLFPKTLYYENDNEKYLGSMKIIELDLSKLIKDFFQIDTYLISKNDLKNRMPKRYINGNKGSYGTLGFVSSNKNMLGASFLFARTALVSGIGKLIVYSDNTVAETYLRLLPEIICASVKKIYISIKSLKVLAIGFGLGISKDNCNLIKNILKIIRIPLLLDADAINIIAKYNIDLSKYNGPSLVLTPHPKEFARLLNLTVKEVISNRIELARKYSIENNVFLVLKGRNSLIAIPSGKVYINTVDSSCLSRAGSGDILSGLISTFLAQGLEAESATIAGVIFHGLCGKIAYQRYGNYSVTSGRIIKVIEQFYKFIGEREKRLYL